VLLGVLATLFAAALLPAAAQGHTGPANPVASSYLARITAAPAGVEARILGGDLRMWLRDRGSAIVVVVDYRGAPYLRFTRAGVDVNTNSAMYYLNQRVPVTPPAGLSARTTPRWRHVSSGDTYSWHDGRLHALAAVALAPGQRFVGRWKIPLRIGGRDAAITGGLYHADDPSIVWLWPVAVILLCLWAAARLGRRGLDRMLARALALAALASIAVLAIGHQLYGEPFVTTGQEIVLALILAFVAGALAALVITGPGSFLLIVIAVAALWAALEFIPVLFHGYVLMTVPAFLARVAAVACLACGIGLIVQLFAFRLADVPEEAGDLAEVA
jgi:hypothetical protein